jgi:hypothetical protein
MWGGSLGGVNGGFMDELAAVKSWLFQDSRIAAGLVLIVGLKPK